MKLKIRITALLLAVLMVVSFAGCRENPTSQGSGEWLSEREYYYLDATWGDASYFVQKEEDRGPEEVPSINYDYLCVTTEEIMRTHSLSDFVPLPVCDSMENNY